MDSATRAEQKRTQRHAGRDRPRSAGLAAATLIAVLAAACGSSAGATPPASSAATSVAATCEQVSAALADGPDPDADPVGYALAQIEPLRAIHTSDKALASAIDTFASAYQTFYTDNGTKAASALVSSAGDKVDKFCPGATS